jgi:hypothetical protein
MWSLLVGVCLAKPQMATQSPPVDKAFTGVMSRLDDTVARGAMRAYLDACREKDYVGAAHYLDLRRFFEPERCSVGSAAE